MAASLSVIFKAIDDISSSFEKMASGGDKVLSSFDALGRVADSAYSSISNGASLIETAMESTTKVTDHWTDAMGNYDKSATEAVYATEELVAMGLKSVTALEEQERMFDLCDQSATSLNQSMEASTVINNELGTAIESASNAMSEIANNERISIETKDDFTRASEEAIRAMSKLEAAQTSAQQAMEAYDAVMISGTTDLETLESAAEKACHASEALAEANGKASNATEELGKASETLAQESERAGESGIGAIDEIAGALAAAGLTLVVNEIAAAVYELADAFSNAEKIIVNATGATEEALSGLSTSMLEAYAGNDDALNDAAGAIGEINTRMNLTGDTLTEMTGLFLDYADITDTNVVGSVQNVTKIMNKWNVEANETESVLDKLAYAGQNSGASVDNLSNTLITGAASFQEMGFSLDNTISMLADFELVGIPATTAVTGMRTAVNKFSAAGMDANTALTEVISQIETMGNQADATNLAVKTFGSRAGKELANAIQNGTLSIDTFTRSLDVADGTLQKTAKAGESLEEKWQKASNNMNVAFTTALQPSIDKMSSGLAGMANNIGDFMNEHPAWTKALTALGVGLGTVVVGISAISLASLASIPAIAAMGTAIHAALGPIGWVTAGVTALTAAVLFFGNEVEDETEKLTVASQKQYDELQSLNAEYERTCAKLGETDKKALELRYQIDTLSDSFNKNKQTVEELNEKYEANMKAHAEMMTKHEEENHVLADENLTIMSLITRLDHLTNESDLTAGGQQEILTIVEALNQAVPNLSLEYDNLSNSLNKGKGAIVAFAEAKYKSEKYSTYRDQLAEHIGKVDENKKLLPSLTAEVDAAQEKFNAVKKMRDDYYNTPWWVRGSIPLPISEIKDSYEEAQDKLNATKEALGNTNQAIEESEAKIENLSGEMEGLATATSKFAANQVTDNDAVNKALDGVSNKLTDLAKDYSAAYDAAYQSIDGQIVLFEKMEAKTTKSVADMKKAMESQYNYLKEYDKNLKKAEKYGLDKDLISSLSDGSAESAGQLKKIVEEAEKLGASTKKMSKNAKSFIKDFNNSFSKVEEAKEKWSDSVAKMETDFAKRLENIQKKANNFITKMDMAPKAGKAATNTMNAYIRGIKNKTKEMADAINSLPSLADVLDEGGGDNKKGNSKKTKKGKSKKKTEKGFATGTRDADSGLALVGEGGPELVDFNGGEIVYTADETTRILGNAGNPSYAMDNQENLMSLWNEKRSLDLKGNSEYMLGNYADEADSKQSMNLPSMEYDSVKKEESYGEKVITLKIEGSGDVKVKGTSKEEILGIMMSNVKNVLMDVIQQEIMEEGDGAYEY